jgi:hypothetical protein
MALEVPSRMLGVDEPRRALWPFASISVALPSRGTVFRALTEEEESSRPM